MIEEAVSIIPTRSVLERNVKDTSRAYTEAYLKVDQLKHVFSDRRLACEPVEYARMESAVKQAEDICADKLQRKVDAENDFNAHSRVEGERYQAEQKELRRTALNHAVEEVSTELCRVQAEYSQLPERLRLLQFRHSRLLVELAAL